MSGYLITFEGGEGAGKSTQVELFANFLRASNIPIVVTREPGGTPLGEMLRLILNDSKNQPMFLESEMFLLLAARIDHIRKVISPALKNGMWVICDRFIHSTQVYQCDAQGFSNKIYHFLHKNFVQIKPDFTFFLDISIKTGLQRARKREQNQYFEKKDDTFHQKIRNFFLKEYIRCQNNGALINAEQEQESVFRDIVKEFRKWNNNHCSLNLNANLIQI